MTHKRVQHSLAGFAVSLLAGSILCAGSLGAADPASPAPVARAAAQTAKLPPGNIQGVLTCSDGVTPHAFVKVTLIDPKTKKPVMETKTDAKGAYVLAAVPAGSYLIFIGNPGLGAPLEVAAGAPAGNLNIMLPQVAGAPAEGVETDNTRKYVAGGILVLAAGGLAYVLVDDGGDGVFGGLDDVFGGSGGGHHRRDVSPTEP